MTSRIEQILRANAVFFMKGKYPDILEAVIPAGIFKPQSEVIFAILENGDIDTKKTMPKIMPYVCESCKNSSPKFCLDNTKCEVGKEKR